MIVRGILSAFCLPLPKVLSLPSIMRTRSHQAAAAKVASTTASSQVQHVFCYGSLRPDDDSGQSWTQEAVEGMTAQRARVLGARLYHDRYAALVFFQDDDDTPHTTTVGNDSDTGVVGWVLTVSDPEQFSQKLQLFDHIECYEPDGSGFYQRAVAQVLLEDSRDAIGGAPIGPTGTTIDAFVYHRPECAKDTRIPSGDWLQRER